MTDPNSDLITRRRFLEFLGRGAVAAALVSSPLTLLSSCARTSERRAVTGLPFEPLNPLRRDDFILTHGFESRLLAKWGDPLNSKGDLFGSDADFTAYLPLTPGNSGDGLLWVNHENFTTALAPPSPRGPGGKRDPIAVLVEQTYVGGSILRVKRDSSGKWAVVPNDPLNRRISGRTIIPFSGGHRIRGKSEAVGTLANCAGGITPWKTFLTCEENYDHFYGERVFDGLKPAATIAKSGVPHDWETVFDHPPEHYGWVVEINPMTGAARKHVSLGRFSHEGATVVEAQDGRVAVYMGDDAAGHCLYKFISDKKGSLERGTLYVANTSEGRWIPLDLEKTPVLKKHFSRQIDVLTYTHHAALIVGGTPLDRPEDMERDPINGAMYLTLTNNARTGNHYGSILKLVEENQDPLSLRFKTDTFLSGGKDTGFSCPDNLAFDQNGNLWVCTDVSGSSMKKPLYEPFGHNGLFYVPLHGPHAGRAFQVASAPVDAEITGVSFTPDQKTLFLSVQHPGETSKSLDALTSHWPEGGTSKPKSAVMAITGPALEALTAGR